MNKTMHEHARLAHTHVDTEPRGQHTFPQWFNFLFAVASCSVALITSRGSCVWACARYTVDLSRPGVFLRFRDYFCRGKDGFDLSQSHSLYTFVHCIAPASSAHANICHPETLADSSSTLVQRQWLIRSAFTEKQQPACCARPHLS